MCLEAKRNLILALVVLAPAFFCLLSSPNWTRAAFHSSITPELYVRTLMTRAVLKSWFQCHMCDVNMRLKAIIKSTYNIQHYSVFESFEDNAAPSLPNGRFTQLSPYFTRKLGTSPV